MPWRCMLCCTVFVLLVYSFCLLGLFIIIIIIIIIIITIIIIIIIIIIIGLLQPH